MDDGAHFYRCDFQVHTPRDTNWAGAPAVSEGERIQYAEEFVAACRARGLQAVAITDHHDLAFFPYIREAALNETDDAGRPIPPGDRLVVFPGMELTLAVPCQALLILDADFPTELLPQIGPALSVTPAPDAEAKHYPVTRLEHIKSLEYLYQELNKKEFLRGRFIVFPHVGENGDSSMLRKGMAAQYKSMPCVGGYMDGPISQHGTGNASIVSGRAKEWGNKAIALFQTSDNRARDFAKLGSHSTWVKWARPTAEALRQACLARHSRISHEAPTLPPIRITRIEVSNSKFLGPIVLDLNPQYNVLIGGRGTGKSTILEYLRWALCDQPATPADDPDAELADFQRRRKTLIDGTLLPLGAVVDVSFLLNGVPHIVRRKASGEVSLKIADAPFQDCNEQNVRDLLAIRAYSQKQLSAVAARIDELRRFVTAPIQADLDALSQHIATLNAAIRAAFALLLRRRDLQSEIASHQIERHSLDERIKALRASLKGLSAGDQAIIARQAGYDMEQRVVHAIQRDAGGARSALQAAAATLAPLPTPLADHGALDNIGLLTESHALLADWLAEVRAALAAHQDAFVEPVSAKSLGPLFANLRKWDELREAQRHQYEEAKARAASHEDTLKQIQLLEARLGDVNRSADSNVQQLAQLGDPEGEFEELRNSWKDAHRKRADLVAEQCDRLTALSDSRLRASLGRATDIGPLAEKLKQVTRGTGTRGARIDSLMQQVSMATDPLHSWHEVLDELLELAYLRVDDDSVTVLPPVPRLDSAGFTHKEKLATAKQLQPPAWLELLLFDLKDLPVFEYLLRAGDYLPFEQASPGQQATILLSILLSQEGPPLLIDQPEDDLNMRIMSEVVDTLWHAKTHRQLIFASHNANLVVNGDAELVICCDYRTSATESGGKIKLMGAIDVPEINREIADVMEGGPEAFRLRQQKYGF